MVQFEYGMEGLAGQEWELMGGPGRNGPEGKAPEAKALEGREPGGESPGGLGRPEGEVMEGEGRGGSQRGGKAKGWKEGEGRAADLPVFKRGGRFFSHSSDKSHFLLFS